MRLKWSSENENLGLEAQIDSCNSLVKLFVTCKNYLFDKKMCQK